MTKKKIAWITDSTAYITKDLARNPDVFVVPLGIVFGDDAYEDGVDLTVEEMYKRIRTEKQVPKTSQPSAGKFAELFEKLKAEGYNAAIAVHISSKLSGTFASCKAGSDLAKFDVRVIDSKSMSYAITSLLNKGIELEQQGLSIDAITTSLVEEADKGRNYLLLGSLEQFYKGGRMSGTSYLLGNILQIKPIIRINQQGEFELFEKVRSEKKASKRIVDLFDVDYQKHSIAQVQIMHGNVPERAMEFENEFRNRYPELDIIIGDISSTIAAHAGEGTVGILWHIQPK